MKKLSNNAKDVLRTVIVLSLIALVAGGLLGLVHFFTEVSDADLLAPKLAKCYAAESYSENLTSRVINTDGAVGKVMECYRANGDEEAYVYRINGGKGYKAEVEYLIAVVDGKIENVVVLSHSETPGLGTNVFKEKHWAQYKGVALDGMTAFVKSAEKTADSDVVFVSGATKTSTSLFNAVNALVYAWNAAEEG